MLWVDLYNVVDNDVFYAIDLLDTRGWDFLHKMVKISVLYLGKIALFRITFNGNRYELTDPRER